VTDPKAIAIIDLAKAQCFQIKLLRALRENVLVQADVDKIRFDD
jgi:hypothetical protein